MNWFKRDSTKGKIGVQEKPVFCGVCSVAYKPRTHGRLLDHCPTCAKPKIEKLEREDLVVEYARRNWEKLEKQAVEWKKKERHKEYQQYKQQTQMEIQIRQGANCLNTGGVWYHNPAAQFYK